MADEELTRLRAEIDRLTRAVEEARAEIEAVKLDRALWRTEATDRRAERDALVAKIHARREELRAAVKDVRDAMPQKAREIERAFTELGALVLLGALGSQEE